MVRSAVTVVPGHQRSSALPQLVVGSDTYDIDIKRLNQQTPVLTHNIGTVQRIDDILLHSLTKEQLEALNITDLHNLEVFQDRNDQVYLTNRLDPNRVINITDQNLCQFAPDNLPSNIRTARRVHELIFGLRTLLNENRSALPLPVLSSTSPRPVNLSTLLPPLQPAPAPTDGSPPLPPDSTTARTPPAAETPPTAGRQPVAVPTPGAPGSSFAHASSSATTPSFRPSDARAYFQSQGLSPEAVQAGFIKLQSARVTNPEAPRAEHKFVDEREYQPFLAHLRAYLNQRVAELRRFERRSHDRILFERVFGELYPAFNVPVIPEQASAGRYARLYDRVKDAIVHS